MLDTIPNNGEDLKKILLTNYKAQGPLKVDNFIAWVCYMGVRGRIKMSRL